LQTPACRTDEGLPLPRTDNRRLLDDLLARGADALLKALVE
jgi:hypothetical protein